MRTRTVPAEKGNQHQHTPRVRTSTGRNSPSMLSFIRSKCEGFRQGLGLQSKHSSSLPLVKNRLFKRYDFSLIGVVFLRHGDVSGKKKKKNSRSEPTKRNPQLIPKRRGQKLQASTSALQRATFSPDSSHGADIHRGRNPSRR